MILKVNDTEKFNISMTLHIDDEAEEITVHIKHWNKQTGVINGYDYPAAEYSKALAKFKELENNEYTDNKINDTKIFSSCKTIDEAIAKAKHNINHFNSEYNRDNLMYWRGVLRGLEQLKVLEEK